MGEQRRFGGVDEVEAHRSFLHLPPQLDEALAVERLGEAVVHGLARERGVGHLDGPRDVLLARGGAGEHDGEQVVALHPLERRRYLAPTAEAQHDEAPVQVPPPAALEDRLIEDGLLQRGPDRARGEEAGHVGEREAVVGSEGDDDGVVVGARLELEVEPGTELLAQRVPHRSVEPAAVRRVDHELHPPRLVEEPLDDEVVLRGHDPEHGACRRQVGDDRGGGVALDPGELDDLVDRSRQVVVHHPALHHRPEAGDLLAQLHGAGRRLAAPEGDRRVLVPGVDHSDLAAGDLPDLPVVRAEDEHVTGHRLRGPVFVHAPDQRLVGFGDDAEVAELGDGAAAGEGGEPGALAAAQLTVDAIVVDVGGSGSPAGLDPVADELEHLVEDLPGQRPVGMGSGDERVEVVDLPLRGGCLGDDLLGEDVERGDRHLDGVEAPGPHRGEEPRALDELVAGERVEAASRCAGAGVVGPADALEERRDRPRRADLAHELHRADVDPQLERSGGDQRLQLASAEPPLDAQPPVLREASVVGGDHVVAEPLAELVGQPLRQPAGVDEHDGGAVARDVLGDLVEHVVHLRGGGHRLELAVGELERDVERPPVPGVDDRAVGPAVGAGAGADQERGDHLDRLLRGRQAHPRRRDGAHVGEPFEREAEVAPALVSGQRVDLVDDDGVDGVEGGAALRGRDEEVERFGRGDDERARGPDHRRPLAGGGVAGADPDGERRGRQPELPRLGADLGERPFEVLGDVDRQRLQRRDVDDPRAGDRLAAGTGQVQPVDGHEEAGQRLAGAGWCGDQGVLASGDGRPGGLLGRRRPLGEALPEPGGDGRVQLDRRQERGVDGDGVQLQRLEQRLLRRDGHKATLRLRCDTPDGWLCRGEWT